MSLCEVGTCLFVICILLPFYHLHLSPLGGLRARLHSSSSVPNFLKFQFLAPVQENDCPELKNRYLCTYKPNNNDYVAAFSLVTLISFVQTVIYNASVYVCDNLQF